MGAEWCAAVNHLIEVTTRGLDGSGLAESEGRASLLHMPSALGTGAGC